MTRPGLSPRSRSISRNRTNARRAEGMAQQERDAFARARSIRNSEHSRHSRQQSLSGGPYGVTSGTARPQQGEEAYEPNRLGDPEMISEEFTEGPRETEAAVTVPAFGVDQPNALPQDIALEHYRFANNEQDSVLSASGFYTETVPFGTNGHYVAPSVSQPIEGWSEEYVKDVEVGVMQMKKDWIVKLLLNLGRRFSVRVDSAGDPALSLQGRRYTQDPVMDFVRKIQDAGLGNLQATLSDIHAFAQVVDLDDRYNLSMQWSKMLNFNCPSHASVVEAVWRADGEGSWARCANRCTLGEHASLVLMYEEMAAVRCLLEATQFRLYTVDSNPWQALHLWEQYFSTRGMNDPLLFSHGYLG